MRVRSKGRIERVIQANPKQVEDYQKGEGEALWLLRRRSDEGDKRESQSQTGE